MSLVAVKVLFSLAIIPLLALIAPSHMEARAASSSAPQKSSRSIIFRNFESDKSRTGPVIAFATHRIGADKRRPIESSEAEQGSGGGYLGVYLGDVNEERARELRLSDPSGAVVGKVEENSPAARAGLKENDVIVSFNNQRIQNRAQVYRLLLSSNAGGKVTLGIIRASEKREVAVELGGRRSPLADEQERLNSEVDRLLASAEERRKEALAFQQKGEEKKARELFDEEKALRAQAEERRAYAERRISSGAVSESVGLRTPSYNVNANRYFLGLVVISLSDQLAKFFSLSGGGVLISEVRAGGAAERAGVKAGDCILAVNDELVSNPADFNRAIDKLGKESGPKEKIAIDFVLTVVRDRAEKKIPVTIETQ